MNGRRIAILLGALGLIVVAGGFGVRAFLAGGQEAAFWEDEIVAFEQADAQSRPAAGAILFTGSSSIRMWKTLARDMAPYRVLNRGFGGAHLDHVNTFAPRIVFPYQPAAIVLYAGDNDIAAGRTADRVVADYDRFVADVRASGNDVPILFVAIKPSRLRFSDWSAMERANRTIAQRCEADPKLHYIDIASPMLALSPAGEAPPSDLFLFDGLHLSEAGYALWTEAVRSALVAAVGEPRTEVLNSSGDPRPGT